MDGKYKARMSNYMMRIYILFLYQCVLCNADAKTNCGYEILNDLVQDEGENIESNQMNYNDCAKKCTETKECNSFSYCAVLLAQVDTRTRCHLKKKVVNPNEPKKIKATCSTSYLKACEGIKIKIL